MILNLNLLLWLLRLLFGITENASQVVEGDACPCITYVDHQAEPLNIVQDFKHDAASRREVNRILHQVDQNLHEAALISVEPWQTLQL